MGDGEMGIYGDPWYDLLGGYSAIHPGVKFGEGVKVGRGVVIEDGCIIGDGSIIGHNVVMRSGVEVGSGCLVGHGTVFEGDVIVGDRVTVHAQCHVTKNVIIEDDVFIGPQLCSTNTRNIVHGRGMVLELEGFRARRGCRIGGGVNLMPGVEVGENAFVGFGSVVTKDVPARQVWYGVPACYVRDVPKGEIL